MRQNATAKRRVFAGDEQRDVRPKDNRLYWGRVTGEERLSVPRGSRFALGTLRQGVRNPPVAVDVLDSALVQSVDKRFDGCRGRKRIFRE